MEEKMTKDEKEISRDEQDCISDCITSHWGEMSRSRPDDQQQEYEDCLFNCDVCA
ncbi:MAG: hypothetical protein M0036_18470 [Desulfobacteraceae bacterium]|nr:hypothetical protein [Desulfobacteraceae bacterium]